MTTTRDTARGRRQWMVGAAAGLGLAACRGPNTNGLAAPVPGGGTPAPLQLTYLSTATVLIELGGVRLLTDPAFDPAGTAYKFAVGARSTKLTDTARRYDALGPLDAVLLSHDQHEDNLDFLGRELLLRTDVARVITTKPGARRLTRRRRRDKHGHYSHHTGLGIGDKLTGLQPWGTTSIDAGGRQVRVVATPAKHGPALSPKVNQVIGFAVHGPGLPCVFISGDTVYIDAFDRLREDLDAAGVPPIDVALIHCGGVRIPGLPFFGKHPFTFEGAAALRFARQLSPRWVVPVHYEGWEHFREPKAELAKAFASDPTIGPRVVWLKPAEPWSPDDPAG